MTEFVKRKCTLTPDDSAMLRFGLSYYCARDIRPFSSLEGPGFVRLAQTFISIGQKYGNIDVKDILPSRTTVSEHCAKETLQYRSELVSQVNAFCDEHGMI